MLKFHGRHGAIMFRKLLHSYSKVIQAQTNLEILLNKSLILMLCETNEKLFLKLLI